MTTDDNCFRSRANMGNSQTSKSIELEDFGNLELILHNLNDSVNKYCEK